MSIPSTRVHHGATELTFSTSLGTPMEGLRYRLCDDSGNVWTGSTGKGGKGVRIAGTGPSGHSTQEDAWNVTRDSDILLEVQRDDGTWKCIGTFRHSVDSHKQISVIAGAVAVPFQMAPV